MRVDPIQDEGIKLITKLKHGSRVKFLVSRFLHTTYVMVIERRKVNLYDIFRVELFDNIAKIKKTKSALFRFESLLTHLLFYVTRKFLGVINCDISECAMKMITQS